MQVYTVHLNRCYDIAITAVEKLFSADVRAPLCYLLIFQVPVYIVKNR